MSTLSKNESILKNLDPEFAAKIATVLANCNRAGVEIQLREGRRNTFTQAAYWRKSRSIEEVDQKIKELQKLNADFLAYCLYIVGAQQGAHATNAIPGLSWHQYGLAVDCVWVLDSKFCWDNENLYDGINGYEILATTAKKIGLYSGHEWTNFRDSGHIQANAYASPLDVYSLEAINSIMKESYITLVENNF